jgi:hypothetical protein
MDDEGNMNEEHTVIDAVFLITTAKEYDNERLFLFIKNLKNYEPSTIPSTPFVMFFDKRLSKMDEKKLFLMFELFGLYDLFSSIEIVFNDIPNDSNIYTFDKIDNIPKFGTSSGPNLHFYNTMKYEVDKYKNILLLETDCFFIRDYWIDIINTSMCDKKFWIFGSKYYGHTKMANEHKDHLNGVGVYNRCPEFMQFINKVFNHIEKTIKMKITHYVNYDIAIHDVIDKIQKRDMLVDSPEILNISTEKDIDITYNQYKKMKTNLVLIHQKMIEPNVHQNDYLMEYLLNMDEIRMKCSAIKKKTIFDN